MSEPADHARTTPAPTSSQLDRLGAALAPHGVLTSVRRLPGGLSCAMDVLEAIEDGIETRRFVLRRYRTDLPPGVVASAAREARALDLARSAGVPAPETIWIDIDGVFAEPALVVSFLEGDPPAGSIDTTAKADQMAEVLTRIHAAKLDQSDQDLLERYVPGAGDDGVTVPDELAAHPLGPPLLERIRLLRRSLVEVSTCFIHADFHPGNTLWRDDRLVGVVDWEIAGIGDPAFDVAYCAADMRYLGLDACADRFIDAYRTISGHDLLDLGYWSAVALARAMPDIGSWLPAFATLDGSVTPDLLRQRHRALVEEFLHR